MTFSRFRGRRATTTYVFFKTDSFAYYFAQRNINAIDFDKTIVNGKVFVIFYVPIAQWTEIFDIKCILFWTVHLHEIRIRLMTAIRKQLFWKRKRLLFTNKIVIFLLSFSRALKREERKKLIINTCAHWCVCHDKRIESILIYCSSATFTASCSRYMARSIPRYLNITLSFTAPLSFFLTKENKNTHEIPRLNNNVLTTQSLFKIFCCGD